MGENVRVQCIQRGANVKDERIRIKIKHGRFPSASEWSLSLFWGENAFPHDTG